MRLLRSVAVFVAVAVVAFVAVACDTETFECECFPCGNAITVIGLDSAGALAAGEWSVTATLDGAAIDTASCDTDNRAGNNQCSFGTATGVYQLTITSPTGSKAAAARFASQVGQNCCQCLQPSSIQVVIP